MSVSGIEVSPEAMTAFNSIKQKGTKKWAFFEIEGNTVVPTQFGEGRDIETREEDKKIFDEEVKAKLSEDQPLYIVYKFQFTKKRGGFIEKFAFMYW